MSMRNNLNKTNCSYCQWVRSSGKRCVICEAFICWDCILDRDDVWECIECEEYICRVCVANCKRCGCCEEYICPKCQGVVCDVCKRLVCSQCCDSEIFVCPRCGKKKRFNICECCLEDFEGGIIEVEI